jgi:hypothetical protein
LSLKDSYPFSIYLRNGLSGAFEFVAVGLLGRDRQRAGGGSKAVNRNLENPVMFPFSNTILICHREGSQYKCEM